MNNLRKRVVFLIISLILCLLSVSAAAPTKEASAASNYIKVDAFIEYVVQKIDLQIDMSSKTPYIDAAMKAGIVKNGDFKNYTSYLTRTDCAVIANRIDKYIYGEHFGYTDEVYELLKDCKYDDGKLYYNMKSDLFPQGEAARNYTTDQFLEEIVLPRLSKNFISSANLGAVGYDEYNSEHIASCYVEIGTKNVNKYIVDAIEENDPIVLAWQRIVDGERKIKVVYEKRISDLKKIATSKRQDVAEVVAKGIIKGYNNGMYIQNRSFKGSSKMTTSGAKSVIKLAMEKDSRASISHDGQLIRITNLPKNASEYPYILECFPNEFYEMIFYFQRAGADRSKYHYPNETGNEYIYEDNKRLFPIYLEPYEYYDTIMKNTEQYINCVFNVDYRTVGNEWIDKLAGSYAPSITSGRGIYDKIDRYLKAMKKNHVVIEGKLLSVEPSTLYECKGVFYVRIYAKYRITADTVSVEDDYDLIFGTQAGTYLVGLHNREWRYGYYDIAIFGTNLIDPSYLIFGIDGAEAGISDGALRGDK